MKDQAADHLLEAVHTVLTGKLYVSEAVRQSIFARLRTSPARRSGRPLPTELVNQNA